MANLNLDQDVANRREKLLKLWPILIPNSKLYECFVTALLLTSINPSVFRMHLGNCQHRSFSTSTHCLGQNQPNHDEDNEKKGQDDDDGERERTLSIIKTLLGFFVVPLVILALFRSNGTSASTNARDPNGVLQRVRS